MRQRVPPLLIAGLALILLIATTAYSQEKSNADFLKEHAKTKSAEFIKNKQASTEFAEKNNIPLTLESEGMFAELMSLDEFSRPQYYKTDNATAAASIQTQKLFLNAGFGFSLNGSGETINLWDAGGVLSSHQELSGRITQVDASTSVHYHSTHVAGTMIASGVVPNSKGMASGASLRAFDWNNDEAEMALEAANGALISNHSYSCVRGWLYLNNTWTWYGNPAISTQEDYLFGFYGTSARDWDLIANNAPYYLICKSAGNDRNEGPVGGDYPKDGPYDCIADGAVSKNVITVGAVADIPNGYTQESDVVMTNFSAWGPVDDGRIKPDIVANGVSVYSASSSSNSSYTSMSGTSMSTPAVSGSLLLLQQHYFNRNNQHMWASTLKALAIHTADEAGANPGPDYQFGWGLMNSFKAVQKITEDTSLNVIDEQVLTSGNSYSREFYAQGDSPLKVTVVWNDPAGPALAAELDPTAPNLVNDLNVKLVRNNLSHYPWKLDPAYPALAATRANANHVDNVEQVQVDAPAQGIYTLVVDYDGTLSGGSQQFSIIISGIAPTPDTGAMASVNGTLTYANATSSPIPNATVMLNQGVTTISQDTTDNDGSFAMQNLENGTYAMGGTCSSPWGGVNATDALLIVKHYLQVIHLNGMHLAAADVDGNGIVNTNDALLTSRRFAGIITSFNKGDWKFQRDSAVINGTSTITKNYKIIARGDADGSYSPSTRESGCRNLLSNEEVICQRGEFTSIPIRIDNTANIGALSLIFNLPPGIESLNKVTLSQSALEEANLVFHVAQDQLKIAWYSITPMSLTKDDVLLHLHMQISKEARNEDLELCLDASSSLANENAEKISDLNIILPRLRLEEETFALDQNIPNPSNGQTTIEYHVNSAAVVGLKVFNIMGQVTDYMKNEASIGSHTFELNTTAYSPGTYYYQLEADINGEIRRETRKMIVAR